MRIARCIIYPNNFSALASETRQLRGDLRRGQRTLDWGIFSKVWSRIVRRVIFGDAAREDAEISSMMIKLRRAANWAFLRPQRTNLREQLLTRIRSYLAQAEPHSLAGMMAQIPASSQTAPEQQVPQWLFAFDEAGVTTFRSLALLASHPEQASAVREEIKNRSGPEPHQIDVPSARDSARVTTALAYFAVDSARDHKPYGLAQRCPAGRHWHGDLYSVLSIATTSAYRLRTGSPQNCGPMERRKNKHARSSHSASGRQCVPIDIWFCC